MTSTVTIGTDDASAGLQECRQAHSQPTDGKSSSAGRSRDY